MSILFTATYPEQVTALILGSAAARWFPAPDYPCGEAAVEMYESLRDIAAHHWGRGDSIEWYLPSRRRRPARPRAVRAVRAPGGHPRRLPAHDRDDPRDRRPRRAAVDSRADLVIHRLSDLITPPFHGRYLAARIAGARTSSSRATTRCGSRAAATATRCSAR